MSAKGPRHLLYVRSKRAAQDSLGGERAYRIAGPSIRRMAVASEILTSLFLQDEDLVADSTVREVLIDQYDRMTSDPDFQS